MYEIMIFVKKIADSGMNEPKQLTSKMNENDIDISEYKTKVLKLSLKIQDLEKENGSLKLEIDCKRVFDEEMERSLNNRIRDELKKG